MILIHRVLIMLCNPFPADPPGWVLLHGMHLIEFAMPEILIRGIENPLHSHQTRW